MYTKKYSQDLKINNPHKYRLTKDLIWSSPKGFDLTMDIYSPKDVSANCPVIVMFHGGGFLIRRKEILNNMSQYIATNHDYVVCNINYRLLRDQKNTVMFNDLIGDAFGAVLWVKENIHKYNGDKDKIVPFSMGKEMFEMFSEPKLSYFRKDDDHMMEFDEELLEKIKNFENFPK